MKMSVNFENDAAVTIDNEENNLKKNKRRETRKEKAIRKKLNRRLDTYANVLEELKRGFDREEEFSIEEVCQELFYKVKYILSVTDIPMQSINDCLKREIKSFAEQHLNNSGIFSDGYFDEVACQFWKEIFDEPSKWLDEYCPSLKTINWKKQRNPLKYRIDTRKFDDSVTWYKVGKTQKVRESLPNCI